MRNYNSLMNLYHLFIREYEDCLVNPEAHGYTLEQRDRLDGFFRQRIADFETNIEELIEEAQQRMKRRPLWKKLLRKV